MDHLHYVDHFAHLPLVPEIFRLLLLPESEHR
jgi:hypothetical protein